MRFNDTYEYNKVKAISSLCKDHETFNDVYVTFGNDIAWWNDGSGDNPEYIVNRFLNDLDNLDSDVKGDVEIHYMEFPGGVLYPRNLNGLKFFSAYLDCVYICMDDDTLDPLEMFTRLLDDVPFIDEMFASTLDTLDSDYDASVICALYKDDFKHDLAACFTRYNYKRFYGTVDELVKWAVALDFGLCDDNADLIVGSLLVRGFYEDEYSCVKVGDKYFVWGEW